MILLIFSSISACVLASVDSFPTGYDRVYNDYPPKDLAHKDPYSNYFSTVVQRSPETHKPLQGFPYAYRGFPFNYGGFPFRGGYNTEPAAHAQPGYSSKSNAICLHLINHSWLIKLFTLVNNYLILPTLNRSHNDQLYNVHYSLFLKEIHFSV